MVLTLVTKTLDPVRISGKYIQRHCSGCTGITFIQLPEIYDPALIAVL